MIRHPMLSPRKVWAIPRTIARRVGSKVPAYSSHYDALGLTPKATQGDIKSAYYQLSMLYHPDKATNDADSAKKFRAIAEAYKVLGNIKSKKMYDKGMYAEARIDGFHAIMRKRIASLMGRIRGSTNGFLEVVAGKPHQLLPPGLITGRENISRMDYRPDPEPTDPTLKFYKSRTQRHIIPTMDGRTPIYDFDSWSKNHYGAMLKDKLHEKEILKKIRVKQTEAEASMNQETYLYMIFGMVGMFLIMILNGTDDYDQVEPQKGESGQKKETQVNVVSNTK